MITLEEYNKDKNLLEVYYTPFKIKVELIEKLIVEFSDYNFEDFKESITPSLIGIITNLDVVNSNGTIEFDNDVSEYIDSEIDIFMKILLMQLKDIIFRGEHEG